MLSKFASLGPSSEGVGRRSAKYLLQEKDAKGTIRAEVKVLRGNPYLVGELIDSLDFVYKYTSGVIAFAPDDQPTDKQLNDAVEDHLNLCLAGLDRNRFAYCAVLHRDKNGGCHVHILIARVDLDTGLSFNPAPPGHQYEFDNMVNYHNYLNGWARPDDPKRARTCSEGHMHYRNAAALKVGLAVEPDKKAAIHSFIVSQIKEGNIKSRSDIREVLASQGKITREPAKSISVSIEGEAYPFKYEGSIYKADFNGTIPEKSEIKPKRNFVADLKKSRAARVKYDECYQKRAEFNQIKYRKKPTVKPKGERKNERLDRHRERRSKNPRQPKKLSKCVLQRLSGSSLDGQREPPVADILPVNGSLDRRSSDQVRWTEVRRGGLSYDGDGDEIEGAFDFASRTDREFKEACDRADQANRGFTEALNRSSRANREFQEAIDSSKRGLAERSDTIHQASFNLNRASINLAHIVSEHKILGGTARKVIMSYKEQWDLFKTDIDLPAYLAEQGFERDKFNSHGAVTVMRKQSENGKETDYTFLIVTKGEDGKFSYENSNSNIEDSGSIIDYVKNHEPSSTVSQIRQKLSLWIGTQMPDHAKDPRAVRRVTPEQEYNEDQSQGPRKR